ncbi:O-antigen ligase family protein [Pyrinomonas sp.]|uniref:O-antigen ligase family protein n=1 Tax=Pyrinomonas sp. TaxID=2080306 RepID=UPI003323C634
MNRSATAQALASEGATIEAATRTEQVAELPQTIASRFIILIVCMAMVLSTLAYGTVHTWSLAFFQAGAAAIVFFWAVDAWRTGLLRFSRNVLQLPLLGLIALGLAQLLPLGSAFGAEALSVEPSRTLSLDPFWTRIAIVQIASLAIYFAATLAFIDSPRRLRLMVRTITIFGFLLALFSMMQAFTSQGKLFWFAELKQAVPFGPFINRHHFAGYMELALALPLAIALAGGAVEADRRLLYGFAAGLMGIALIMTNSRGGLVSLVAEIIFLISLTEFRARKAEELTAADAASGWRPVLVRLGVSFALLFAIVFGSLLYGGEESLSRFIGTVNSQDPTTGRAHFWSVTLDIIRDRPLLGVGLGAYSVAYTRYDTRGGQFRVEQAHNDYLQTLSDAGVIGAALGLLFIVALFRLGFLRRQSRDPFRRAVATGAMTGCFAVLVHSFFDFTLHTTANALLFLLLAALATVNGRVEEAPRRRRRRRRRSSQTSERLPADDGTKAEQQPNTATAGI